MLSNPSTVIVVYREMPWISIPDSKQLLGEHENVDVVMSNQPEQSAESCPEGMQLHWQSVMPGGHFLRIFVIRVGGSLVTERAVKYPNLFRQDCVVLDSNFWQLVENAFEDSVKTGHNNSDDSFAKMLVDYVEGAAPNLGKPWKICRYLYLPYCVPNLHWFAVEIDLEERRLNIFDSLTSMVRESNLGKRLKPLKVVVPRLMQKYVNQNYSTSMFTHHRVKKLPVQDNGHILADALKNNIVMAELCEKLVVEEDNGKPGVIVYP
ncbi:Ulp1 protease family protein [Forsythia ovata]|uniref:Ulp1 protease family protein n=1 Tax=Forsythia ovata TaxID=205694 RepID=A0ABD1SS38_9LAMI